MIQAARILHIPIYVTTQNAAKLGDTVRELDIEGAEVVADKSLFSMCVPAIMAQLHTPHKIIIVGIESHVCVLQTTLDLVKAQQQHEVYVLVDGVSSCNAQEVPIALARIRQSGGYVSTSESCLYELMRDASIPEFKSIAALVKDTKASTKRNLELLSHL